MTTSLRAWLKPLRELKTEQPIVDKFIYVLQPDFYFVEYGDSYNRDNIDEDFRQWREVDLRVNFVCKQLGAYAVVGGRLPPAVVMAKGDRSQPYVDLYYSS